MDPNANLAEQERYTLYADDIPMWVGASEPSQSTVDRVAKAAIDRGWNGVALDLHTRHAFVRSISPSAGVFA